MQFYERNSTFHELVHVHTQIVIITQNTHIIYAWNQLKLRRLTNPDQEVL